MQQLLLLFFDCPLALQHRQYQSALTWLYISFSPFPGLFESNYQQCEVVRGSMGTQEGPKLSDLLEKQQHFLLGSEGEQVPANELRLLCPMRADLGRRQTDFPNLLSLF